MEKNPLAFVKPRLFTPGPTEIPLHCQKEAFAHNAYHRTEEFSGTLLECRKLLATFFGPGSDAPIIFTSSGTGAMEACVRNIKKDERPVICLVGGKFGERWSELAQAAGHRTVNLEFAWGETPDLYKLQALLQANPNTKAVFFQGVETSTGIVYPVKEIAKLIKKESDALVICDAISYLGTHPMDLVGWDLDMVVGGSQKCFGCPPGLAFLAISAKGLKELEQKETYYFDIKKEYKSQKAGQTAYTPAVALIYCLKAALLSLHEIGLDNLVSHYAKLAKATRLSLTAMDLKLVNDKYLSNTLTVALLPEQKPAKDLLQILQEKYNACFTGGQDQYKGKIIRIAHTGFCDPFDILSGIAALEAALQECGLRKSTGDGVQTFYQSFFINA